MSRFATVTTYQFVITLPSSINWCPSDLMHRHANATPGVLFERDYYFASMLVVEGVRFYYDHYQIHPNNNGTETVTVTMKRKGAA